MSFDVNPTNNKPVIREAASMQNDGGAGNLGYFEQEENRKKKQAAGGSIFETNGQDSFELEGEHKEAADEEFSFATIIAKIILFFKNLFKPKT